MQFVLNGAHRSIRVAVLVAAMGLSGCAQLGDRVGRASDPLATDPIETPVTRTGAMLFNLAPPSRQIDVAVYGYEDKTGQNEEEPGLTRFSREVTQGAEDVLYDILEEVGGGSWFNVVERAGLQELLTERELIDETARAYRGAATSPLPPLRFAGTIIRGGVIDYDSNVVTGGAGARILGIGINQEYREDRVSVALRAVSVETGEVLSSVTTEKTIYSVRLQDSIFRYVASDRILELDAGVSQNEPTGIALRHAMELAVFALIVEGTEKGVWSFRDRSYQNSLLSLYYQQRAQYADLDAQIAEPPAEQSASGS
ncbi:CsgG/HfaB family protein [Histidinibacterium aquaticum]|uniref:Curli production assembly protein CsgG n=1 Tax=Histidinibacterium aquaticum TaxID=2613962 RepID=A0A5J5GCA2_9RHOB|nr:CsgG/HfaB family protein [Histidinibacterium aquaticum]KAA9005064.1 curli production assembly protein CsgG [Histidinibacterium aquaticum]